MVRQAVAELENAWGKDKFQEWYEETIIPLNGKIYMDYHGYYTILQGELEGLYDLYNEVFGNDLHELMQEQSEMRGGI
jgi:hypothetical protein